MPNLDSVSLFNFIFIIVKDEFVKLTNEQIKETATLYEKLG